MILIIDGQVMQTLDVAASSLATPTTSAELQRQYDEIVTTIERLNASLAPLAADIKVAAELEATLAAGSGETKKK